MNWITKNNYTIKRKFNQINNKKNNIGNIKELKNTFKEINTKKNYINKNQINFNINALNQDNNINKNYYSSIYYQINGTEALEQQLKKGENFIQTNLNYKYILSELNEF